MIHSDIFYLFLIISIGYIVGNFKIKGFSLDISAMLIVSLIAGHFGLVVSEEFKFFGLAIFIYAVGLQSGPGFFETIKTEGIKFNILSIALLSMILAVITLISKYLSFSATKIDGIFTGTLSSVPSLAAALEIKDDPSMSVLFGMIYPFCIVATVLFIRFLPIIFKVDIDKEKRRYEQNQKSKHPEVLAKNYKITNQNFKKDSIKKSKLEKMTDTIIQRVESRKLNDNQEDITLHYGDIIRVSGKKENLENVGLIVGEEIKEDLVFHDDMKVFRLLVTSKNVVGKKIGNIKELRSLRAVITKVRRSGIDIHPYPDMTLMLGDKLYVIAPRKYGEKLTQIIGNSLQKYPAADFLPISLGIVFGILLGSIPFDFPLIGEIKLSFVGGILITALILGRLGRVGSIVWQMSPHSTTLMKTLGQLIFIAAIGTNAGKYLLEAISKNGFTPIYIALFGLIFSLFCMTLICRFVLKMNFIKILGLLSGSMTSTPSLTMANSITKSNYPSISYAAVYPLSLVLAIVFAQLVVKVF